MSSRPGENPYQPSSLSSLRLQEARDRLDSVVDHIVDAIITIDEDGIIETVNRAAETQFLYMASEMVGRNVSMLMPQPYAGEHDSYLKRYLQTRVPTVIGANREVIGCRKDGTCFPMDLAVSRFRLNGRQYFTGIVRDISAQKELQREQFEANQRLRSVVDHIADGIVTVDSRGIVRSFNAAAERLFGYPAEAAIGKSVSELLFDRSPDSPGSETGEEIFSGATETFGVHWEALGRRRDGSFFPIDVAVSEFQWQEERFITGIIRDITERKRDEQRTEFLASTALLLSNIADSAGILSRIAAVPVPLFADWTIVEIYSAEHVRQWATSHRDRERKQVLSRLKKRLSGSPTCEPLARSVFRQGEPQLIEDVTDPFQFIQPATPQDRDALLSLDPQSIICVPLRHHGKALGVITFVRTDAARCYSDSDLPVAEDFAHRASIAIENARLYEESREADRRKDEFLATLAHELRNPLAPVRNALSIVRMAGIGADQSQKAFDSIDRQIDHMVRLVDDLLDLSRVMRGKIQLRRERVELRQVVERAVESVKPIIDAHGHRLVVRVSEEPVWLHADPVRLDQVVSNLLNNAVKYTERGGLVRLSAKRRRDEVVIKVRDTGIGIDPKFLPHLFDLFRQEESALDRSNGGLGIGLTLVRNLVDLHGGKVAAFSDGPGTGAEFVVRLPVLKRDFLPARTDTGHNDQQYASQLKILAVDDNVDAAEMLVMLLQLDGHVVRSVHCGLDALDAAAEMSPDVVLLDIGLPDINGYEVARRLRAQKQFRRTTIIAMTGFGQERDRRRSLAVGCDEHLTKPVAPQTLRDSLKKFRGRVTAE